MESTRLSRFGVALILWVALLVALGLAAALLQGRHSQGPDAAVARATTPKKPAALTPHPARVVKQPERPAERPAEKDGRPSLIFVLVDTLRADHVGYHGYGRKTSPVLDAFAARSVAFMSHHSHSSRTGPSVASIFTGLHPKSHGVLNPLDKWNAKGTLAESQTTIAEILAKAGYATLAIVTNVNLSPRFGFAQGFSVYDFLPRKAEVDPGRHEIRRPFFLYLHYMQPHSPYNAPKHLRKLWVDPRYKGPITGDHGQLDKILDGRLKVNAADRRHLEALYDQEIRHFDEDFDKLLGRLKAQSLLENTIIVVVADHGEEFFDHGGLLHGYTLYQEQLHVPLVIHDPRLQGGRRVKALTRNVDLLPTLLELLGVKHDGGQGRSLVPLLRGERSEWDEDPPVLAETQLKAVKTVKLRSLMAGGYKLVDNLIPTPPRQELYNLAVDPAEKKDLIEQQPEQAKKMREAMAELLGKLPAAASTTVQLTDTEREQLRALGYIK